MPNQAPSPFFLHSNHPKANQTFCGPVFETITLTVGITKPASVRVPKNIFESETQCFFLDEGAEARPKVKAKPNARPHARNILSFVNPVFMLPNSVKATPVRAGVDQPLG